MDTFFVLGTYEVHILLEAYWFEVLFRYLMHLNVQTLIVVVIFYSLSYKSKSFVVQPNYVSRKRNTLYKIETAIKNISLEVGVYLPKGFQLQELSPRLNDYLDKMQICFWKPKYLANQ